LPGEIAVTTRTLTIELPEELLSLLGSPEDAAAKARETLVIDLLREGRISQGQAARLLDMTRWDLLALASRHDVPVGPETAEEMRREVDDARRSVHRP
jgi:predicted HTH domain antitoxin